MPGNLNSGVEKREEMGREERGEKEGERLKSFQRTRAQRIRLRVGR